MGVLELLALMMALSGASVDENPAPPTADDVLATAPARADYVLHADLVTVVPNNYARLLKMPDDPRIARNRRTRDGVRALVAAAEQGRAAVRTMLDFDPVNDLHSITLWVGLPGRGDEQLLAVVRGVFPTDLIERLARQSGSRTRKIRGVQTVEIEPGVLAALSPRGELLVGSAAWVKPRLRARWKRKRGSPLIRGLRRLLDANPAFLYASAPGRGLVRKLRREMTDPDEALGLDLLTGHQFLGLAIHHDGVEWTVTTRTDSGYRRAVQASEGALEVMRSLHSGSRGVARLMLAALPSFADGDETIRELARYSDQILDIVLATTGDGHFAVRFDKKARARTVHVRASAADLNQVLPGALLVPMFGGAAAFVLVQSGPPQGPPAVAAPPAPAPAP